MRILVTNDDGISAPGIAVLERIAARLSDDVWTVAPEQEQSATAHSLTLHVPVRLRHVEGKRYAVSGTPTDSVLLGLKQVIPVQEKPVTLVLSGVNRGSNVGDDVTYSGTVAGAMEGAMFNIKSIALSQLFDDPENIRWDTVEAHAPAIISQLLEIGWGPNILMNVNFPDCAPEDVKGVQVCPQGKRIMNIKLMERVDPKGRPYFWLGGERDNKADREGVDIAYLHDGYITITPLNLDLTEYRTLATMREAFSGLALVTTA